jgi:transposase
MQKSSYPTDLTDEQWEILEPLLPAPRRHGRPPSSRRMIINGLLYLVRAGCSWRLVPKDFGPWQTICGYFRKWRKEGLWALLNETLRTFVRREAGHRSQPTAAILDSQTVRSADHAGERGYDAAKKTTGRKRHVLVDTLGLLLWVCVTPADVPERAGAAKFLSPALKWFGWLGYLGRSRLSRKRIRGLGGFPPQDRHAEAGNCAENPPRTFFDPAQAVDCRAHLWMVGQESTTGSRLRNQNRQCQSLDLHQHDRIDAPPLGVRIFIHFRFLKHALR